MNRPRIHKPHRYPYSRARAHLEGRADPLGGKRFVRKLEKTLGRVLRPQKSGHPRNGGEN